MSKVSKPTVTEAVMAQMAARVPPGMEIPPKVFTHFEGEMIAVGEKQLTVRFPVREQYQNPMGMMQGGVLATLIDNTLGPLSFMVAPPSATSTMQVTFIRPVAPEYEYVDVTGRVVDRTTRQLIMDAEVQSPDGKRLATATAIAVILGAR